MDYLRLFVNQVLILSVCFVGIVVVLVWKKGQRLSRVGKMSLNAHRKNDALRSSLTIALVLYTLCLLVNELDNLSDLFKVVPKYLVCLPLKPNLVAPAMLKNA